MLGLFEPNIHPLLVHFALALVVTSAACFLAASVHKHPDRRRSLTHAADWMLAFGTIAALATLAAGFQAYYSVVHDGPSHAAMTAHRNWAIPSVVLVVLVALWRYAARRAPASGLLVTAAVVAAFAISATAWRGGGLVYQYGLGVASLPAATGAGHDHHGDAHEHANDVAPTQSGSDHDTHRHAAGEPTPAVTSSELSATGRRALQIATAFSAAIRAGDADAVRALSTSNLLVGESGGLERSFEEYASHHLPSDMAFSKATTSTMTEQQVIAGEHMAVVVTQSQIHGRYREQAVHSQLVETLVIQHIEDDWRLRHVHWSSAPLDGEHVH